MVLGIKEYRDSDILPLAEQAGAVFLDPNLAVLSETKMCLYPRDVLTHVKRGNVQG